MVHLDKAKQILLNERVLIQYFWHQGTPVFQLITNIQFT